MPRAKRRAYLRNGSFVAVRAVSESVLSEMHVPKGRAHRVGTMSLILMGVVHFRSPPGWLVPRGAKLSEIRWCHNVI